MGKNGLKSMEVKERQARHFWRVLVKSIRENSFLQQISAKDKTIHMEDSSLVLCLGSGLKVTILQVS